MIRVLNTLIVALVAVVLGLGVQTYGILNADSVDPAKIAPPPPLLKKPFTPPKMGSLSSYQIIADRDLFKTKADGTVQPSKPVEELKPTSLKLKLLGTVSEAGGPGYAVVEDPKSKEQNLYRVGDLVASATVKQILREKIVLSVNGKEEILEIEDIQDVRGAGPRSGPEPRALPASEEAPPQLADVVREAEDVEAEGAEMAGAEPGGGEQVTISKADIQPHLRNINSFMKQVRIRPFVENAKPSGLVLTGIGPESLLGRMGLQNGDILTRVNADAIVSTNDALKLYRGLKSSSAITLGVRRGGQPQEFNVQVEN
ncbi:MAG: hypothetical protein JEZ11_17200 [Desulfobacterales bacterium]|nr:hypothetical protein [Desulfobacterales bacterium]